MKIAIDPAPKIAKAKAKIRAKYAELLRDARKPYSLEERNTWGRQAQQAKEYLSDHTKHVRMLTKMAARRGISPKVMAEKIKKRTDAYDQVTGDLLGRQQKELEELNKS